MANLLTVSRIADRLGEPPQRVGYIIRKYRIKPVDRVGITRLFDERQVKVDLDFSRTARFTNLTELGPRLLSIGSNQDGDGRTHSFLLKKDKTATQPIKMTEAVANNQIARFVVFEPVVSDHDILHEFPAVFEIDSIGRRRSAFAVYCGTIFLEHVILDDPFSATAIRHAQSSVAIECIVMEMNFSRRLEV